MGGFIKGAATALGLLAGATGLIGCGNGDQGDAAKTAEKALGVDKAKETSATTEKRDVLVIQEKQVKDAKTGQVLSAEKTVTPVTVEKAVKTDYKARTGETQTSPAPKP